MICILWVQLYCLYCSFTFHCSYCYIQLFFNLVSCIIKFLFINFRKKPTFFASNAQLEQLKENLVCSAEESSTPAGLDSDCTVSTVCLQCIYYFEVELLCLMEWLKQQSSCLEISNCCISHFCRQTLNSSLSFLLYIFNS